VGPPVFKTGEGARAPWRVRFPSASATRDFGYHAPGFDAHETSTGLLERWGWVISSKVRAIPERSGGLLNRGRIAFVDEIQSPATGPAARLRLRDRSLRSLRAPIGWTLMLRRAEVPEWTVRIPVTSPCRLSLVDEGADQDRLDALPVSGEGPASVDDELFVGSDRGQGPDDIRRGLFGPSCREHALCPEPVRDRS
jgi:hypothetical protein